MSEAIQQPIVKEDSLDYDYSSESSDDDYDSSTSVDGDHSTSTNVTVKRNLIDMAEREEENGSDTAEKENVSWVGQLQRGDAVSFRRKFGPFKYKHHGIVEKIIPGTTRFRIIHVTGTSKDLVSSISTNVNTGICSEVVDFTKETDVFKYHFQHGRQDLYNPAAVAEMFLDYGLPKDLGFHIFHFNCESFSRYCATGIVFSKQTGHVNEDARLKLDGMVHINGGSYR